MSKPFSKHSIDTRLLIQLTVGIVISAAAAAATLYISGWSWIYWAKDISISRACALMAPSAVALSLVIRQPLPRRIDFDLRHPWLAYTIFLTIAISITVSLGLDNFANAADEYAYLFQAQTFGAGRLWNPAPPLGQAMGTIYTWVTGDRWAGQYPPLWPAILAAFATLTPTARLANIVAVILTGVGIAALVRQRAGSKAGWMAALLFACTPFTLFNGASYLSHPAAAALGVWAMFCSQRAARDDSVLWAMLAGLAIGALGLTRTAPVLVFAIGIVADQLRERSLKRVLAIVAGGLPCVVMLLAYQHAISGNAFKPVYWLAGRTDDHLYFDLNSIATATAMSIRSVVELALWTSPFLLIVWSIAAVSLFRVRALRPMDVIFPLGFALFLFYPLNPGIRFGPRYYFDFWPMIVVTIGSALSIIEHPWRDRYRKLMLLSVCYSIATWPLLVAEWRMVTRDREEVYRLAEASNLSHAVVCLDNPSGRYLPLRDADFPRNGIAATGSVLFVRCAGTPAPPYGPEAWQQAFRQKTIDQTSQAYPDRSIWTYSRRDPAGPGRLSLLKEARAARD